MPKGECEVFSRRNNLAVIPHKLRLIIGLDQTCFWVNSHEGFESFFKQLAYFRGKDRKMIAGIFLSSLLCSFDKIRRINGLGNFVDNGILEPRGLFKIVCSFTEETPGLGYPLRLYPVEKIGDEASGARVIDLKPRIQKAFPDLFSADSSEAG
jgi:hypothetical protein